tara:strand:+ start:105 stop:563 length:459 start_codon:yes stop_codon:yes gene_type:complete
MTNKIFNFVFLILLFLLQSCSGGKIGNFLESSFRDNISNKISQQDVNKKLKNDMISKKNKLENKDKTTKKEPTNDTNPAKIINSFSIKKNDENVVVKRTQNYDPKTYRIFIILKKVDPSFPTENFSKVLRNGNIKFEIEKIELIPELNQNKK